MKYFAKNAFIETYGHVLMLVGILLIALFLRTYHLHLYPPGLFPDEAMNGNNALEAIRTGSYKVFYPENNGREGLFINIQSLFLRLFAVREPWVLRFPSTIFGTLTVLGIYLLARELFGAKVGLLAAFLLATSFWHLVFSRIGFRAITAPFYATWGLWLLVVALRAHRFSSSLIRSLLAGLVLGLGFHSYIAYRIMPALAMLLFLFSWFDRREERGRSLSLLVPAGLFLLGFVVAVAPLLIHFIGAPQDFFSRTAQISIFTSPHPVRDLLHNAIKTGGMFHFAGDSNWRHNFGRRPQLLWPVGIFFLVGIGLAVWRFIAWLGRSRRADGGIGLERKTQEYVFCLIWLAVAAAPVIISNEGIPHALRAILMIPPVFILSACGGSFLYETVLKKLHQKNIIRLWKAFAFCLLLVLFSRAFTLYFYRWGPHQITRDSFNENYVKLGEQLLSQPSDVKKYVIVRANGIDVRGLPIQTQTTMFITDTFLPEGQREKNIYYVKPEAAGTIPAGAQVFIIE